MNKIEDDNLLFMCWFDMEWPDCIFLPQVTLAQSQVDFLPTSDSPVDNRDILLARKFHP